MNSRPLEDGEGISEGCDIIYWLHSIGKIDADRGQEMLKQLTGNEYTDFEIAMKQINR